MTRIHSGAQIILSPGLFEGTSMAKARRSGFTVKKADVPIILGMLARGDRRHDVAAWFGLNQGRVAEVEDGDHGTPPIAPASQLPPSGSPGPKALVLRAAVGKAVSALESVTFNVPSVLESLKAAATQFDENE